MDCFTLNIIDKYIWLDNIHSIHHQIIDSFINRKINKIYSEEGDYFGVLGIIYNKHFGRLNKPLTIQRFNLIENQIKDLVFNYLSNVHKLNTRKTFCH